MKFSKKGYLRNSPDVNNSQNIIQGGNITMKGVDFKVHGVDNNGYAKVMTPGYDYNFPNAKYVTETPIKKTNMSSPFQKKFCAKSPLKQEIDPTQLQYRTTNTATTLSGEVVPTGGEAVVNIPGQEVERLAKPGTPEYDRWQAAVEADPSIEDKYKDRTVTVTRTRDYSSNVDPASGTTIDTEEKLYPNPFRDIKYTAGAGYRDRNKRLTAAQSSRDSLSLSEIKDLGINIYGPGFYKMPEMASWIKKQGLTYGKKRKPTSTENLSDYRYDIRTGN